MNDPIDFKGRIIVGRRMGGFETAALIDGDIDHDCALFHQFKVFFFDQMRGFGTGDQHGSDDRIGFLEFFMKSGRRRIQGLDLAFKQLVQFFQTVQIGIQNADFGT